MGIFPDKFLSIQAQDFIEDHAARHWPDVNKLFLSIQAQDFIEDDCRRFARRRDGYS